MLVNLYSTFHSNIIFFLLRTGVLPRADRPELHACFSITPILQNSNTPPMLIPVILQSSFNISLFYTDFPLRPCGFAVKYIGESHATGANQPIYLPERMRRQVTQSTNQSFSIQSFIHSVIQLSRDSHSIVIQ